MRRLPVYFVVDVSESMIGDPLLQMENAIERIVAKLRQDPQCLETVYISVIAFAGKAKVIAPLVDLISFYPPRLPIGGGTSLGRALDVLVEDISSNVKRTTYEQKGDWNPLVFLVTDGKPTDAPEPSIRNYHNKLGNKVNMIVITLGYEGDSYTLNQLSENVVALEDSSEEYFASFVEWVSSSIQVQSSRIEASGNETLSLNKNTQRGISLVKDLAQYDHTDPSCVTLVGRCSETAKPYLIKYQSFNDTSLAKYAPVETYHLVGGFGVSDSYFDWTDERYQTSEINTSLLDGAPSCPHCVNQTAFAMCECGKLTCVGHSMEVSCPWCERPIHFGDGGSDFSVGRGQG
ncbi:hypothetical protein BTO01_08495 [Vibrio jasicida]|uniref:TerY-C metal binding domain-containing protein n=1 Tax=Vibrio jasicida TaxID=766224 RepID=UPI000CF452F4|nr:TerY-C metal binding domain-containing protein [Vibrio jasicida]PQJ71315.1 hypothetical protein BTO01_08495 [Vibrio jasicida]